MCKHYRDRNHSACVFSTFLLVSALFLPGRSSAQVGFNGPGRYQITNARTGGVLEMDRDDQTSIRLVPVAAANLAASNQGNQVWEIEPAATQGYFIIRNPVSNNALETVGPRSRPMVRAMPYHGDASQQWRFDADPAGATLIVSRSGRILNTPIAANWNDQNRYGTPSAAANQSYILRRVWDGNGGGPDRAIAGSRVVCSSDNDERVYCNADTHRGVRLFHEMSVSACEQGTTWGYDQRGVWVDQGCRAEFLVLGAGGIVPVAPRAAPMELIPAGATIVVRTNETIEVDRSGGRTYTGSVEEDVVDEAGRLAIPKGSPVELVVKGDANNELALDLDSVTVNDRRYAMFADTNGLPETRRQGIGENRRTGEFVGGGAVLGAIIGAIAGGGKGAAIGGLAGAAAGAGTQVLTRGRHIQVPSESVLTFRLEQPLQVGGYRPNDR